MKKILFIATIGLLFAGTAWAEDIYFAQDASGTMAGNTKKSGK